MELGAHVSDDSSMIGRSDSRDPAPDARAADRVTAAPALDSAAHMESTTRSYSPGLKGVLAGETSLAMIDGEAGRLQYRGYPIGELVEHGTYRAGRRAPVDR